MFYLNKVLIFYFNDIEVNMNYICYDNCKKVQTNKTVVVLMVHEILYTPYQHTFI